MACDPEAVPVASDDVDGVQWMEVSKLRQLQSECARLSRCCWLSYSVHVLTCGWSHVRNNCPTRCGGGSCKL